ncbi:MAG: Gfo/Idh/MocA family oxidoreductase [Bacteroidota bacterium]
MSAPLRVGLVGCGRIAQLVHLNALRAADGIQVVALADPDTERLHDATQKAPSAVPYASAEDLLAKSDAEAVVLCTPPALHAAGAIAAFEAGKHVYLEKPISLELAEADAILAAQQAAGTVGQMGFNYRFHPLHREARERIQRGNVGELVSLRTVFSSPARSLPGWKSARASGGGVMLDLASHHLDLIPFLTGRDIIEVIASTASHQSEGDTAALTVRLEGDLLVQSLFSMTSVSEDRFEIYGTTGKLAYDRQTSVEIDARGSSIAYGRKGQIQRELGTAIKSFRRAPRVPGSPSFRAAFEAFGRAARGGPMEGATLEDGRRSLEWVLAAERASETGDLISRPELATA